MRVLIADDHPMVRDALAMAVRSLGPEVAVAEADCYAGVCTLASGGAFDLAVVDLNMPGMNGVAGLRGLRSAFPTLALIVASGQDDPATSAPCWPWASPASSRRASRANWCCRRSAWCVPVAFTCRRGT